MSLPQIVSREEWLSARKELLAKEKAATRARNALNAERRGLPMVEIDKECWFRCPERRWPRSRTKGAQGVDVPWYSSYGSDFNYDFHVTMDESVAPIQYNYRSKAEHEAAGMSSFAEGEYPGTSYFLRDGDRVFHTYSSYARGAEMTGGSYYFLDLTALGRQEEWEEPKGRAGGVHAASPDFK